MSMVPITAGTGAAGAAGAVFADRRTEGSCPCCPSDGPTTRQSPIAPAPIAMIAREEMTIGTTPFLPLVIRMFRPRRAADRMALGLVPGAQQDVPARHPRGG